MSVKRRQQEGGGEKGVRAVWCAGEAADEHGAGVRVGARRTSLGPTVMPRKAIMQMRPCLISTTRRRYSAASSAPRPRGSKTLPSGVPPKIGSLMPPTRSSTAMLTAERVAAPERRVAPWKAVAEPSMESILRAAKELPG